MDRHSKPGTPQTVPSKLLIINWVRSLFSDLPHNLKIEDFGQGIIYARILNHFYGNPVLTKISWHPRNEYDYINNLKQVQTTLSQLSIVIPFDVNKIAKCKFLENWSLINSFYKHFHHGEQTVENNSVSSHGKNANLHNNMKMRLPPQNHSVQPEPRNLMNRQNSLPMFHPPPQERDFTKNMNMLGSLANSSLHLTTYLKENVNMHNNSPNKGKWSVGSHMFHNSQTVVVDRIKEILLKGSHDTEKVRQIKMLLGMPTEEQEIIKIEQEDNGAILYGCMGVQQQKQGIQPRQNMEKQAKIEALIKSIHEDDGKQSVSKFSAKKMKKPFKI